jgi:HAD superfamily hydrolase (TIGR01509 family)
MSGQSQRGAPASADDRYGHRLEELVSDVDLLCLDAGNTIIFFDHARLAHLCARQGFAANAEAFERAEGHAKLAQERGEAVSVAWSYAGRPGADGWAQVLATMLARAGMPLENVPAALDALWVQHRALNLWSQVPAGLVDSLIALRASGVKVAVVSNSEGKLQALFEQLDLMRAVDCIVDSGILGVEKPDPRIFQVALDRFGVLPGGALHLGDNFVTDVGGARAAGLRVALIDPFGHLAGRHADVPRVSGVSEVADAIVRIRGAK